MRTFINVTKTELPELSAYVGYLQDIWAKSWITNNGICVQTLEKKLERYLGIPHVIAVANGTLALQLAYKALDLTGEVITTAFTFPATTHSLLWEGLTPVFADIDPHTFTIDPREVEKQITAKTSAIVAVHVYGNPCHLQQLQSIARRYHLKLIYDAAHTFGVEFESQSVLQYGDISTLSFHATKIFSTAEGGAIIVKDPDVYEKIKLLRNFGIQSEEEVVVPGINAKMNELSAALGLCDLKRVRKKITANKTIYQYYMKRLRGNRLLTFPTMVASKHNYAYMPVCFPTQRIRDAMYQALLRHGVKPRKYFYPLITETDVFRKAGVNLTEKYRLHHSLDIAGRVLCLPIYSSLDIRTVEMISTVINAQLARLP